VAAAEQYGLVVNQRDGLGLPIDGSDARIAAICHAGRRPGYELPDRRLAGHEMPTTATIDT
jgi:hypothetical protein